MKTARLYLLGLIMLGLCSGLAQAVNPDEILTNPELEARARAIGSELRCLVCQNQSIDDSNSGLARDLRVIVRERLTAGDSDEQVFDFVVQRFGNYVLLKPPYESSTYALWWAPLLAVFAGLGAFAAGLRRRIARASDKVQPLSAAEIEQLKRLELES